jgi:hypothetical protein
MAKEYIEAKDLDDFRNELMDKFLSLCNYNDYNKITLLRIGETVDEIYDKYYSKPLSDVVEVVRCKDCAWYDEWNRCVNSHCTKSYYGCHVKENHFCSYGERKDGAE